MTMIQAKKQKMDTGRPSLDLSTPHDVECEICAGTKLKAVSCCPKCCVFCCDAHCKTHNDSFPGQNHKMVDMGQAEEIVCFQHKKPLMLFCQTDKTFVCLLCTKDEHTGHNTAAIFTEREKKQVRRIRLLFVIKDHEQCRSGVA